MSFYFGVDYYPEHWPQDRWETAAGEYIVHFGSSSADIRAKAAFSNARPSAYAVTPGLFERK